MSVTVTMYPAAEIDAMLQSRDAAIADLDRRVSALEGAPPSPNPAPEPPAPPADGIVMLPPISTPREQASDLVDGYYVAANPWNTFGDVPPWEIQVGIGRTARAGAIDAAIRWSFERPQDGRDVWAFPETVYGVGGGFRGTWPGWDGRRDPSLALPARIGDIKRLVSSVDRHELSGTKGLAQVTYDLWVMRPGSTVVNTDDNGQRLMEIMIPTQPIGGYGVPNWPEAAAAGRSSPQAGRFDDPYVGRHVIAGIEFDVYRAAPGSRQWPLGWTLAVFLPVRWPAVPGRFTIDWRRLLDWILAQGWGVTGDAVLAGIEYGVEPSGSINTWKGDAGLSDDVRGVNGCAGELIIRGFSVDAETSVAPTPPPPPPSGVWTDAQIERAIRTSTGLNEGLIPNVDNSRPGWRSGSAVVMGSQWNYVGAADWWPWIDWPADRWWPYFTPWFVLFTELGNTATDGWIDVRGLDAQIKRRGASSYERIAPRSDDIGWIRNYEPDMVTEMSTAPDMRPGLDGGVSIRMPMVGNPHGIWKPGNVAVAHPETIEAVMTTLQFRIDPRGDQRLLAMAQVGGDPKPGASGKPADYRLPYFVGFGVSAAMRATSQWQEVTMINLQGGRDNPAGRVITQAQLRAVRPLA